jgi:hypothetical protein
LQRQKLATLVAPGACNVYNSTAPHCYRPSSRNSRAFCDAITSNVTLPIFVYPRTFIRLGTSIKHPSVQGHSSDFRPLNLCPSTNFRSTFVGLSSDVCWTFIKLLSYHLVVLHLAFYHPIVLRSTVLPFRSTSVRHCSFPSTHHIFQTVHCVKTL